MNRVIVITKCAECPKMLNTLGDDDPYCGASERMVWLTDIETIPDWCPLERAPETKGASDE